MLRQLVGLSAVLLTATVGLWAGESAGPQVTGGTATFAQNGANWTVTTGSNRTVIRWNSFGVPQGSTTQFIQPGKGSAVLNKVTGSLPSEIAGALLSNGRVYLLNPNGILVGPSGVIRTAGFVASTLGVNEGEFLEAGTLHFAGGGEASVVNLGTIEASSGPVLLIAPRVENHGTIRAADGVAGLVAGRDVLLTADDQIYIQPSAETLGGTGIENTGTIEAARAELVAQGNLYGLAINNSGTVNATSVVEEGGRILLRADGGRIVNSGTLTARTLNADGKSTGGTIEVAGAEVILDGPARLDVSGDLGGGTIHVGGNYQGQGPLPNAQYVWVGSNVEINADALEVGDGGTAIFWSDLGTWFYGSLSAKGGASGGDGGFAEISGKAFLRMAGSADLSAANGSLGTLLLDPTDIEIQNGSSDGDDTGASATDFSNNFPGGAPATSVIFESELEGLAENANVTIQATNSVILKDLTTDGVLELALASGSLTIDAGTSFTFEDTTNTIRTNGGDLIVTAASATLGVLDTTGSTGTATGGNISVTTSGTITLHQNLTTLDGNITLAGAVSLQTDLTLNTGDGNASITGALDGNANTLTVVSGAGTVTFGSALSDLDTLDVTGGTISLGGNVTTTGTQDYHGDVEIAGASVTLTTTDSTVTFDGAIEGDTDGGQALTVSVGNGDIVLSGDVGATNALASLNLTSTSTTIEIGGNVTTAGAQVYDGHVLITGGDVTLTGVGIQFTGDVDGSGTENLTVDATTGTADFQGAVGLLNNFEASGAAILFAGDVTTDGTQTYTGAVELFGDRTFTASDADITFDGAVSGNTAAENLTVDAGTGAVDFTGALTDLASLDATGTTIGVGANVTTSGAQDYHGDVSVNGTATLSGTDLTFEGTVTGSGGPDLTVSGTGTVDFQDEVSALNSLAATGTTIQIAADVSTTASQSYTGDVILFGDLTLNAVGVTFSATVTGNATSEVLTIASTGGTVDFGGEVSDLGSLDVTADSIEFAANVTTTNAQTYTGDVALNGDILFTTTDHDVTFDGAVTGGGNDLTVAAGAGDVIVTGAVSGVGALDLTGATIELGGDVTTTGAQTYQGNVQINESLTLTGAGLTFEGTVAGGDGDEDLTVDAGATTADFQDAVSKLSSFDVTGAAIQLATDVTTTGLQSYDGAVTIFSSLTLTAGDVTFVSTVEGDTGAESLTIDATGGTADFGSTVDSIDVLDVTGATIRFAADVTTEGAQTFTGDVELTGSVLFTTSNDGVTFDGNVDGGTNDLTVDAGTAAVEIAGNVTDVGTLDLTGTTIELGGDVTTTVSQTYRGNVVVNASLTLTGAGILFEGTVAGGVGTEDLTVDATTGTADFQDAVSSLNNFDASGVDIFLATDVTTTGTQDYDGSVRLYGDVILTGSGVAFSGIVEGDLGSENLTVDATGGTADFGGDLSSLASLDVTANTILLGADVTTTGAQDYNGAVELQANVALTTSTAGDVTFADTVDGSGAGGQNLTLDVAGAIDFQGAIGSSVRLGAIQVDDATDLSLLGLTAGSFTQVAGTGTTTFDGAVDLDAAGGLNVATDTILVNGTVDTVNGGGVTLTAASALTIDAAAVMNLDGAFLENGAGTVNAAGSITTSNADVTFTNIVTLDGDLAVTSGGGQIEFLGGAVGSTDGGESLTLDAGSGGFTFGGDLGAAGAALNDLTLTSDQLFTQDVDIVAAGTVLLQTAGATQNAGFTVQADTLLLEGTGDFTLNGANDVSSFGTSGTGVAGDIVFNNGTTNLTTLAIDTTGTGNLTLRHDGTLDLMGAVSLTGSFVEENAAGTGAGGLVTLAQDLNVAAGEDITFKSALAIDGTVEISTSGAGNLNFFTIDGATVDTDSITLTVDTGSITYTGGLGGGTRFDNITLNTGAGITIDQDLSAATQVTINAGGNIDHSDGTISADTVTLTTTAGGATQSGTASIDATTLLVEGTGNFTLNNANSVDEFGTSGAGVAGDIVFNNGTTNLTTLAIDTTGTGNLTLRHDGTLDLMGAVSLTGSFVEENAAGTGAGGLVTLAQDLNVAAGEDITFKSALAIDGTVEISTSGAGNLNFFTIDGATVDADSVTLTLGTGTLALGGAIGGGTRLDNVTFNSGAGITLNQNVTAATQVDVSAAGAIAQTAGTISADTVTLTTSAGGATQSGTASIDATTLLVEGTGNFTLNNANSVDEFGTSGAGVAGDIVFNNGNTALTTLAIDTTGSGNLTLRHDGTLDLSDTITLTGSFVEENAAGTGAGGLVTLAQDLSVAANQNITFKSALEVSGDRSISTSGTGNLSFFTIDGSTADTDAITLTVDTGSITYSGAIGGATRFDAITLNTGAGITLGQDLDAASLIEINAAGTISHTGGSLSAATVHLNTTAGGVSQAVGSGGIAATILTLEGTGNFSLLDADNAVGTLETNGALAGDLTFVTGSTVTTGDITADAVAVEHTGALTLGGDITADSFVESNVGNTGGSAGGVNTLAGAERTIDTSGAGGAITFKSNATLNSDLTLNAGASGGTITLANVNDSVAGADTLDLTGGGFAFGTLGTPNRLGEIALTTNQAGGITVTGTGLNADRITFENTGGNLTVGSALTADEITLTANGMLAVNGLLTALDGGAGLVTLSGTGITQTAGIRTDTLELDGTGSVVLNSAANQIEALTALSNTLDDVQVTTNPASGTFTLGAFDTTGAAGTGDLTVNFGSDNLLINGPVDLKGSFSTGASSGGITLAGDLTVGNSITFTGTLGVSGVASLTSGAGGGITLGDVTGAGADLTLTAGSLGIDFNGNVGTSGGRLNSLTLNTDGPVTQDAGEKLHANTLTLLGDAMYALRTNILTLDGGGATLGGSLSLANDGALAVDVNPLTVAGDVTLRTLAGAITINEDVSSTGAGGTVTLDAAGGATTTGGSTVSADNLLLSGGGTFDLATSVDTVASTNLGAGSVTLVNDQTLAVGDVGAGSGLTAGGGIDLTVTAGDLTLNRGLSAGTGDVSLDWGGTLAQNAGTIAGGTLTLAGDSNAGLALALNVSEIAGTVTGSSTLALNNAGVLTFTGFDADTNSLRVNAGGANGDLSAADLLLTGTGIFNLDTTVGTLAANVTGALTIDETDGLIVGTVNGENGVQTAGGNDISLTAGGALILNQQVNAGAAGDVTLDFATLGGAALVTGNVLDLAGASGFTLTTDVNVLQGTLTGAAATTVNNTGALNLNGFDASGISLRLSADGATGSVTSNELQLNGTGVFNLTTTVNTLAANVTGALSVDDTDGLTVGTVGAVTGVNSNGSAVTLGTNGAGVLALNQDVTAAGATVILDAAGDVTSGGGTVTAQTLDLRSGGAATVDANVTVLRGFSNGNLDLTNAGHLNLNNFNAAGVDFLLTAAGADGTVSAGGLAIFGTGAFALTSTLDRLAGNVNGAVTITDAGTLTIGTVGAQNGLISTGGDIRLTAPGGLNLAQDLRAAGFEIHLQGNGALQTGGTLEADRLRLAGPGAFTLTGATNDVNVLAAQTNSALSFTDVDNLTIGAVGVTVGIDTSGNNLTLSTGGMLILAQEVRAGLATTTFNVAAGGVNQVPGARIMSDRLLLTGAGAFNLLEGGNLIRTLAGNLTGGGASTLNFRTAGNLFIGTVGVQNGILTTGGSVTLAAPGGFIQVDRPINTGAGPPGTATLTGDIRPANPMLAGSGDITLTAQILPGGGAGNTTTFQLNPSIPMGPQDGGFTLPDLGNVNIGIDTFDDPDGLGAGGDLGTNGDDLQITLPEELLKAFNTVLSVTSTTGFEDEGLRNSLDEFQASEQALTLAQQVLDHAAKVLRSLQPGDPLREALQKLIDEVNAASQEVRKSNVALAELIAKLYADGRPDRVGKDALEGALKGMQRANERLLVTSRALEAALKAIQQPAGAPAAPADRAVLEVAAQRAREQATREAADARDRQDRVGQDAKFATLEEYKAQEKGRKPEGTDGK
ncbi:MAG: hypothetical protein AMXMBFR7_07900 [Planctomycetota bacterium]